MFWIRFMNSVLWDQSKDKHGNSAMKTLTHFTP